MTEKALAARRAYKREWAQRNREKVQEYQARYWERRAEQAAADPAPAREPAEE